MLNQVLTSGVDFDPAGSAAAAQAASQPLDADLTAIAALTTTSFGRGGLTQVDAAAFRAYIGAGTGSSSGANPTASVGLAAVNGSAATFMRSDGAPALSQSIAPTWTATHTFSNQILANSGVLVPNMGNGYQALKADGVTPMTLIMSKNGNSDVVIDPAGVSAFVQFGHSASGHNGPSLLLRSGAYIYAESNDFSQDLPIIRSDTSDNVRIGNANSAGSSLSNDVYVQVQTGKTIHCSVNDVDVVTVNAAAASKPNGGFISPWFTGGSTTTTKPALLVEPTGATSAAWSTNGTGFGVNAASGFTGNLIDLQLNGVSKFLVTSTGNLTANPTGGTFTLNVGGGGINYSFKNSGNLQMPGSIEIDGNKIQLGSTGLIIGAGAATWDVGYFRAAAGVAKITNASTAGGTLSSIPLTPAQITGDTNNYAPSVAMFYRLSSDASRTLTGLSIGQVDGQLCEIWNVGSQNIVLANESASSSAANRFTTTTGSDVTLTPNQMAFLRWFTADQSSTGRWRVVKGP